jgi:ATP-dependent RNA helicase RhlE
MIKRVTICYQRGTTHMTFEDLGLSQELLDAVSKKGYNSPSPIQEKAIPPVLKGKDVLASAQTGTGKTAGFTLPMLQNLSKSAVIGKRPIRALILTPTRELAAQVHANVKEYSEFLDINSTVIFGGVNANPQKRAIRAGVDILVATPGRLLDLHQQKVLSLAKIEMLVLDEADRMLDMGFIRDIKKILSLMPKRKQSLLFSATFSREIKELAGTFLYKPVQVEATPENTTVEVIKQKVYKVDKGNKAKLTIKLISEGKWEQVLIFTRTKHGANRLSDKLNRKKITASPIHGNKSQGARTKALAGFKDGSVRVLVATDIAARGLDIPLLPHVINFELPNISEDYVHRIGRTGRAGASGEAISLVCVDELAYLKGIEKLIGEKIEEEIVEGFEPVDKPSDPKKKQQNNHHRRNKSKGGGNWKNKNKNRNRNKGSGGQRRN